MKLLENIQKEQQRFKLFISQYQWKWIKNFPVDKIHKNKTIALNVLFSPNNREEIKQAYISKHNSKREKQVILIITDGKKWQYLATKNLLVLL